MTNENFRRELGQAFDDMTGAPSPALRDRVRSSLAQVPEQRGPFWIAGVAAAAIAVVLIGVLFVANPLNRPGKTVGPVAGSSPTPTAATSPGASPSATVSPSPDSNLPAFVCSGVTQVAMPPSQASPAVAFIDSVRTGTHAGYDRITIEFLNGVPGSVEVRTQASSTFTQGASGQQVTLAGSAGILITIKGADEHTNYSGPIDFKTAYPVLRESRQTQDFEGTVQWALGIAKSACYRAFFLAGPARLVIDVQA